MRQKLPLLALAAGIAAAPLAAAAQNAAPQNAAPQNTAPQNTAPQNTAPQNAAPQNAAPQKAVPLKSVSVELPSNERSFAGPGSDAANNNCLGCHSAGMVLDQPALPKAAWAAEVEKMRQIYKAPIEPKDVEAIVNYLVSIKGTS